MSIEKLSFFQYYNHSPRQFNSWAAAFLRADFRPNPAHFFVFLLLQKCKLLRMYTQNVDGLEAAAGVPDNKLVAAHGSLTAGGASCVRCGASADPSLVTTPETAY